MQKDIDELKKADAAPVKAKGELKKQLRI